ncbi:DNA repair helicase [Rickenella mellea]|uniref:ATP-dependent DNA helicase CHL1 n=1 Tax=Rickenella mellea TaxID=50990 RepID=A0A4Y7Q357_9AGAM|nr:DNA repair helicase [Rickenella mellea]
MALVLPVPADFPAFPYRPPYSIQVDLMRHLYEAIEQSKVAIIESPTGTGKTLSLLCASLSWLFDDKARSMKGRLAALEQSLANNDNEPEWVLHQTIDRFRRELLENESEFEQRLTKAKRKEAARKMAQARVTKKPKLMHHTSDIPVEDDDVFLPDVEPLAASDEYSNLSLAAQSVIRKLKHPTAPLVAAASEEGQSCCTKIFYASRTHSQLAQLVPELKKLAFLQPNLNDVSPGSDDTEIPEIKNTEPRMVALASRTHLCINDELRRKVKDLDEGCRELLSGPKDTRCPYLPTTEDEGRMLDFRDEILASPKDIEDLVVTGKNLNVCPYFGSRKAIPQAQLVSLPYNLLLHRTAREALEIDVTDHVVIFDEAHNLIDTVLQLQSVTLSAATLRTSLQQLSVYLQRFRTRLTSSHAIHLKRLVGFMRAFDEVLDAWRRGDVPTKDNWEETMSVTDLIQKLGSKFDGVNLLEILSYLRTSKIARKISRYSEKVAEVEKGSSSLAPDRKQGSTPPLHAVESLLFALTNDVDDGVVTLSLSADRQVHFKYQHLNPSTYFNEITNAARCVILAGGTMSPFADFTTQLLPRIVPDRMSLFSCDHVVPAGNIQCITIPKGPSGKELEFKYNRKDDKSLLEELGQVMFNLVNIVPAGMVVFFPSYAFLEKVKVAWKENGLLMRLTAKKKLFFEPRDSANVESVLREYYNAVHSTEVDGHSKGGAIMLAVVGAKLSEGLNFSDDLARAVILVGLPFANLQSMELKERMKYLNATEKSSGKQRNAGSKDAGSEMYENLCMKAVNQSIGRAIRHRSDWSSLILIDRRYDSPRIRSKLPHWIGKDVKMTQTFGNAVKTLSGFFRDKKDKTSVVL